MNARVVDYARRLVLTLVPELAVREALERLAHAGVTGAPVVDAARRAVGVLSLTDLVALEVRGPARGPRPPSPEEDALLGAHLDLALTVGEVMTPHAETARHDEPLGAAAERMAARAVHRLVVTDDARRVEGIVTTLDVIRAVADAGLATPCIAHATRDVACVERGTPAHEAVRQLLDGHHHCLPVTDLGWPIGLFTQVEALAARRSSASAPVEELASPALLCLPEETPLAAAAAESLRQDLRRVLCVRHRQVTGILTSADMTRAYAEAWRARAGA